MLDVPSLLVCIVIAALFFDYTNGGNDVGNIIATVVFTNALSPKAAVIMASTLIFMGTMLGHQVAKSIVHIEMISGCRVLVLAALSGSIIWNIMTRRMGLPSSSFHALIGGLVGSAIAYRGWHCVEYVTIIRKVLIPIAISPLSGFALGFLSIAALSKVCIYARPYSANLTFRRLQLISTSLVAFSHGMNGAQKTMGILTLAIFLFNRIPVIAVPLWVKLACSSAITLGTAISGWKIIKTMGCKFFKIETIHGFAIQTSSALVIILASIFGAPVSTVHVISSAVLGTGASKRLSAVRWGAAGQMAGAWMLTLPASAIVSAVCLFFLRTVFND